MPKTPTTPTAKMPYQCTTCDATFPTSAHLAVHCRRQHGRKIRSEEQLPVPDWGAVSVPTPPASKKAICEAPVEVTITEAVKETAGKKAEWVAQLVYNENVVNFCPCCGCDLKKVADALKK